MNKKAYTPHTFTPFALMVSLFFALTLTIQGKDISPKRAASIAKKYVKLLHNNEQKAQAGNKNLVTNTPYYIYITMHKDMALLSCRAMTKWAKCWHIAESKHSIP